MKKYVPTNPLQPNWEDRYAENWSEISAKAKQLTNGRCCFPKCRKIAIETHHAIYRDKQGPIAGKEIPGVHVFPLCQKHHSKTNLEGAHHPRNWQKDRRDPVLGNQQTNRYYLLLRQGWKSFL